MSTLPKSWGAPKDPSYSLPCSQRRLSSSALYSAALGLCCLIWSSLLKISPSFKAQLKNHLPEAFPNGLRSEFFCTFQQSLTLKINTFHAALSYFQIFLPE